MADYVVGTRMNVEVPNSCFQSRYGIYSKTISAIYNADGTSSETVSATGPGAGAPYTANPASAPWEMPFRKWSITAPDTSFTNQTTTVELRPVAGPGETSSIYALFVINVAAWSSTGTPVPSGSIAIGGTACDAQGNVYLSHPLDGSLRKITPTIGTTPNYEYNISVEMTQLAMNVAVGGVPTLDDPIPVWVSDRIDVLAHLSFPIDPGSHRWLIDGTRIKRFNAVQDILTGEFPSGGPIWWTDPRTPSTTFTWVSGGNPATYKVQAQARVKGKFVNAIRTFKVTRPTVSPQSFFPCAADPSHNGSTFGLLGGCLPAGPLPGYPPGYPTPGFFSHTTLGQPVIWVQLASSTVTFAEYPHWSLHRSTSGLDGGFPSSSEAFTDDTPHSALNYPSHPQINYIYRSDIFKTQLMLARSGPDFAVPIGLVDWRWSGTAQRNSGIWSIFGTKQILSSQPSSAFPTWATIANAKVLVP